MSNMDYLTELFASPGGSLPADVSNELQSIMSLLSLSAQETFYKWESYVLKMGVESTELSYKTVKDFKKDLQDALERESRAKEHAVHGAGRKAGATPRGRGGAAGGGDVFGMLDGMASGTPRPKMAKRRADDFGTPASKSVKNGLHSSPAEAKTPVNASATAFEDRQNAGQVIESLNAHLPAASAPSDPPTESRVRLKANTELPKFAYKNMAMKLSESSEILDDRIDSFTDLVQSHHELSDSAFGNPAAQSTAEIVAVGRIACDQPVGKLNAASLVLETSRRMGAGMRVPLRLEGLGYNLFPGKIVALRGSNVSGEYFSVAEILELPLLTVAASTPAELDDHNNRLTDATGVSRPLSMLVASGPFTTDTDLSFAPLHTIISRAETERTDVLILTGPFLDLEHPLIASGDLEPHLPANGNIDPDRATLQDIFRLLIAQPLQALTKSHPTITIILVPSVRDAISKHASWPQDRFPRQPLGLPRQVQIVTNPITLSINETIVGISTQDILSELRRENVSDPETQNRSEVQDPLARLANQLIDQRHFFPIFPPQARENLPPPAAAPGEPEDGSDGIERLATGASLDLGYLKLGEWLSVRPDVLILPSALSPFAKVINSVLCLNPSTLSKKRGPGTYTAVNLAPRKVEDAEREAGGPVAHEVFARARCDVIRV